MQVGFVFDIISLLTQLLLRAFPSFGLFAQFFTATPFPAKVFGVKCGLTNLLWFKLTYFLIYFTRTGQALTSVFICLNRASAILLPLSHEKVNNLNLRNYFDMIADMGQLFLASNLHYLRTGPVDSLRFPGRFVRCVLDSLPARPVVLHGRPEQKGLLFANIFSRSTDRTCACSCALSSCLSLALYS